MTKHFLIFVTLFFTASLGYAQSPFLDGPLPSLMIEERGEIVLEGDDFSFRPWNSEQAPSKVHILQYFGATQSDSELFKPFIDALQESLTPGTYHVTTIINLDAAMWGTTGFVVSEVKTNKRNFPEATIVLDEDGVGVKQWQLGKVGAGLVIVDGLGVVRHFSTEAMNGQQVDQYVALVQGFTQQN